MVSCMWKDKTVEQLATLPLLTASTLTCSCTHYLLRNWMHLSSSIINRNWQNNWDCMIVWVRFLCAACMCVWVWQVRVGMCDMRWQLSRVGSVLAAVDAVCPSNTAPVVVRDNSDKPVAFRMQQPCKLLIDQMQHSRVQMFLWFWYSFVIVQWLVYYKLICCC